MTFFDNLQNIVSFGRKEELDELSKEYSVLTKESHSTT